MSQRRKTTICRDTWYYLVVLGVVLTGAMLREINLLFVVAGMIAGPLLVSWRWVGVSMRGLRVERRLPEGVCAGDLLVVNVELTNTRRRLGSWAVVAEDQVRQGDQPALQPAVYIPYLPAGQSRQSAYRGRLPRRGRYDLGPFQLSTRFPFGLLRGTVTLGRIESLVVLPRLGRLARGWIARPHESFEGAQRRRQRFGRVEGEFYGVRDWRSGDTRRSIHWRSSARRGTLVVRQYDEPHNQDVVVLVELWQPVRPSPEDLDRVELAVSFAATTVSDLCRRGGGGVMLGTTAHPTDCTSGPASPALLRDAMEQLALAEAVSDDRLSALLATALSEIEPGAEVILVTTRSVDLYDTTRFGALWRIAGRAAVLRRIRVVDTSSDELGKYFQAE